MTKYRRKPLEIEAYQAGNGKELPDWLYQHCKLVLIPAGAWYVNDPLTGIIPMTNELFQQTYEVSVDD